MTIKSLLAAFAILGAGVPGLTFEASAQQPPGRLGNIGQALQPVTQPLPQAAEQVRLVNDTIDIFLEAAKARSMRTVWNGASQAVRTQFTPAQLDQAFSQFFQIPISGKPLAGLTPIFTQPAIQVGPNAFRLVGHFATTPSNVNFDITYVREGAGWRWNALNVRVAPPGEAASGS